MHHGLVAQPRRRAETRRTVIAPVDANEGLLRVAVGRRRAAGEAAGRVTPTATQPLHLVECGAIGRAVQRGGRRNLELADGRQHERLDPAPEGTQRDRLQADGVLAPLARPENGYVLAAVELLGKLRAVGGPEREDRVGGPAAQSNPTPLCLSVPDLVEVFREQLVEARLLRRVELDQRIVRRLGYRGVHGGVAGRRSQARVALVAAGDGVHGIEDRDVDDGKGPARSVGAQLLPEDPVLSGAHGRVVERVGDEQDFIPAPDGVLAARAFRPRRILPALEARPKIVTRIAVIALGPLRPCMRSQAQGEKSQYCDDRMMVSPRAHTYSRFSSAAISDMDHVPFPLVLSEPRDASRPQFGHPCSVTETVLATPTPLIAQVPQASRRCLPAFETLPPASPGVLPKGGPSARSRRVPREPLDARDDLP